jgi:hypothetical protein
MSPPPGEEPRENERPFGKRCAQTLFILGPLGTGQKSLWQDRAVPPVFDF